MKVYYMVLVLGPIGKSPRMQYHALSLAKLDPVNSIVDLIGFEGPKPHKSILEQDNIHISFMSTKWYNWTQPLMAKHFLLFLLFAPIKLLIQWFCLMAHLLFFTSAKQDKNIILVQNVPAIPTLILVPVYMLLMRCLTLGRKQFSLIIDWHNYAHTLMVNVSSSANRGSTRLGPVKRFVLEFAKFLEMKFGKWFGNAHLCVSNAMKRDLEKRFQIQAIVHYDRPPKSIFMSQSLSLEEQHELYKRVFGLVSKSDDKEQTLFTIKENGLVSLLKDRPALVVSSTSWTADEDFDVLLKAIELYDKKQTENKNKKLQVIITGSGPLKKHYEQKMAQMNLRYCKMGTKWLESEDYPKLLSCCDLGVCLHYSSSGVDLPMKVVDMFGSGVPVCAIDFKALPELVQNKKNGYIFENSEQLCDQLYELFVEDKEQKKLKEMKSHIKTNFQTCDWDMEWTEKVKPVLAKLLA